MVFNVTFAAEVYLHSVYILVYISKDKEKNELQDRKTTNVQGKAHVPLVLSSGSLRTRKKRKVGFETHKSSASTDRSTDF